MAVLLEEASLTVKDWSEGLPEGWTGEGRSVALPALGVDIHCLLQLHHATVRLAGWS